MSFSDLGLTDEIVRAVTARGYTQPTPIQAQAIPAILAGHDLLASAQTGTGKTAGFTLPILHLLAASGRGASPGKPMPRVPVRSLVLTPTRELAAQVEESIREYGQFLPLRSTVVYGGVGMQPQVQRLRGRVDILVATPGRLLDHVQQGTVDLSRVEILVLDEADRMLDMGFLPDIRRILAQLPKQRQNLLFSATFSDEIKKLASGLLHNPVTIEVAPPNATADLVAQKVYPVDRHKKRQLLTHLIQQNNWFQVLVFTRTKHGADHLVKHLGNHQIPAMAIHGNKSQAARTRALAQFKDGSLQVLVATDIASRGIDISELPHVINFELPHVPEDYVHRIGRTGRAGTEGEAASLVCVDELKLLADIEKLIRRSLPQEIVPGFEPDLNAKPEPIPNGRNRQSGGRGRSGGGLGGGSGGGQARSHSDRAPGRAAAKAGSSGRGDRPKPSSNTDSTDPSRRRSRPGSPGSRRSARRPAS
ncbi:DEAD/DEAH box helicase [Thermoleptolyngbya sp. C42_A2020_037]|uniref:DEAD/DEAH box helicase n=1 Tax=Thermoleptolyngbya sp. C42_A2020_037 TaxID=2747799 RepID=UPI001A03C4C8|nr:DEAD/DEAH box helicase [Thermoleptolyngbya sp. C42_A2020_037]MBF2086562.1 DEAD/DEAH box helicase [Thermoleptolyngbya sp. C42_A2020_037]